MMKQLPSLFKRNLFLVLIVLVPGLVQGQFRGKITTQPVNASECEGIATVTFKIGMARSIYGYTYEWQMAPYKTFIFRPVSEATHGIVDDSKSTLILEFNKGSGLGALTQKTWNRMQFRCVVVENIKLAIPETSNTAYLYVLTSPSITKQPVSADKTVGESVSFSISASGSTPRTYQWQFNDGGGYDDIPGATGTVWTIASLVPEDAGSYRCVVKNQCGTRNSSGATLTVFEPIYDDGWFMQTSNTSKDIYQVSPVSNLNIWAVVYDPDKLLHTVDGGETWTVSSTGLGSYNWSSIHFNDANKGFVGTYGSIARTLNGGSSWTRYNFYDSLSLSGYSPTINDFCFLDASTGWAVGNYGLIIKTTDGGTKWSKLNHNGAPTAGMDGNIYAIWFTDSQKGWVAGENGRIYNTLDGGTTWSLQGTPNTVNLTDITFTDANHGFATGWGYRNLLVTSDGGTTWALINASSMPSMVPSSVNFTNTMDGWMAGYKYEGSVKSDILRTNDGGLTWYRQYLEEGGDQLRQLHMMDSDNGWAVGYSGTILRTATGGCLTPTVNLYGDEALCASESYTMRADTFANNLNCSYLWSTGATTGHLTVSESNDYSVTVTSLCGVTAEDSKTLEFYPLPPANAGADTFMCYGDTIQLNASGGVVFSWTPGATLTNPSQQNPGAFPISTTTYFVSVTDTNGCINSDNMTLTVNPIPTSTFSAPAFVCGTESASINYTGSGGGGAALTWDFDGGTDTPSGNMHSVSWAEIGTKTVSLVVEENTCVSDTTRHEISVNPIPLSPFTLPAAVCGSDEVDIVYDGVDSVGADYAWSFDGGVASSGSGEGPYKVSWATEGTKSVSLTVTQNGCVDGPTINPIIASYPYEGQDICLIMVDEDTERNLIVWERSFDPGIKAYRIFKESASTEYEFLADISQDNYSQYVDSVSSPRNKADRYKIAVVDTCDNVSSLTETEFHQPIFLQVSKGDGVNNLNWSRYLKESGELNFKTQYILGGTDSTAMEIIDSVSGNQDQYSDYSTIAQDFRYYYRIEGVLYDACNPTGGGLKAGTGPYYHSLSNMDDNQLKETSTGDLLSGVTKLSVYPNPFSDKLNVKYNLKQASDVKIEVYNLLGVRVLELENTRQVPGSYNYNIRTADLDGSSIYYLRFGVDKSSSVIKLVPVY